MRKEKLVILYEDTEILVCRKPSGLPVQTQNTGRQDLVNLLRSHRAQNKEEPYIGPVSYTHLDVYKRQGLKCVRSMEKR